MEQDKRDYEIFLGGDNAGFERLVLRYKDALIQFIMRYVRDIYLAEDLAQDAFVEVLLHKERYRMDMAFKTYLYTIGRNKAIDYIRKNSALVFTEDYAEVGAAIQDEQLLEEQVIKEEEKRELYQLLKKLKPEYERVLYLIDLEELSYAEAAQVIGKSENQVRVLIHRARKKLQQLVQKEEL